MEEYRKLSEVISDGPVGNAESPVAMAGQRLHNALTDLDNAIARLIHLIEPIMSNNVKPENPRSDERPFGSDLANYIHTEAMKAEDLIDTVCRVAERLEI